MPTQKEAEEVQLPVIPKAYLHILEVCSCLVFSAWVLPIDLESLQNRLLKVCYVSATSANISRLLFLFLVVAINSTNEANKAGGTNL